MITKCVFKLISEIVTPVKTGYQKAIPAKMANTAPIDKT